MASVLITKACPFCKRRYQNVFDAEDTVPDSQQYQNPRPPSSSLPSQVLGDKSTTYAHFARNEATTCTLFTTYQQVIDCYSVTIVK